VVGGFGKVGTMDREFSFFVILFKWTVFVLRAHWAFFAYELADNHCPDAIMAQTFMVNKGRLQALHTINMYEDVVVLRKSWSLKINHPIPA